MDSVFTKYKTTYFLIIIIFGFILYGNSLFNDYALDDAIVITNNSFTKKGISGIKDILTNEGFTGFFGKNKQLVAGGRYRPLSLTTFAIEYQFFGLNPFVSHFVNIILYILTAILILLIFAEFFPDSFSKDKFFNIPLLASILFLAHPIHTEVVANIKGRDEIMTMLGAILTLYITLKYVNTKQTKYLIYSAIVFFLALMSKENAITFVAIIPLSIYYFKNEKLSNIAKTTLPLLFSTIVYLIIRTAIIDWTLDAKSTELMNDPYINSNFIEKTATNFYTMLIYIKLLFFPHPLTFDYYPKQIPIINFTDFRAIFSVLIYMALLVIAIKGLKKKTVISYGIWFYLISFSVVSNIVFNVGTFMNERFMYLSSLGFVLIISYLIIKYILSKNKNFAFILTGVIILGFTTKTISRNFAWKNDYILFTSDVKTSSNSAKSNTSAGGKMLETVNKLENILKENPKTKSEYQKLLQETMLRSSEIEELLNTENPNQIKKNIENKIKQMQKQFVQYLEKAVKIHPKYNDAWILLGNAYYDMYKNVEKTWLAYKQILDRNPGYDRVYQNMDIILNDSIPVDTRIKLWTELRKYNKARFNTNYQLGHLYGRYKNNVDTAVYFLLIAVNTNKNEEKAWKDLGVAYGIKATNILKQYGQDSAKVYFLSALEAMNNAYKLKPNDSQLLMNIGLTYLQLKNYENAIKIFENAVKIEPNKPKLINNLYIAYANSKNYNKAISFFNEILKTNPNNFYINYYLSVIYKQVGNIELYSKYYNKAKQINPKAFK